MGNSTTDSGLPPELEKFINEHVHSVEQLEVLLLLHREQTRQWTADEVAKELRIDGLSARGRLVDLAARELVAQVDQSDFYRYAPNSRDLASCVDELAKAYVERRVTVIGLIFSKPSDVIRVFADAFRFRKGS